MFAKDAYITRKARPEKSGLFVLALALAACLARGMRDGYAAEAGPVAHYTFDEGAGNVLRDVSGNGHDGKIVGAAYVRSPRGYALRFDGKDDYVDCGRPGSLNLAGDLTIMAWLRPTETSGRNRMIFGDDASLTIHRNYNLRLSKGRLWFEFANDQSYGMIMGAEPLQKGKWQHIALVCEHPRYYLYRNGRKLLTGRMLMPLTPTQGATRRIGGWFAGYFAGDIDEIVLYNRAVSDRTVMAHYAGRDTGAGTPRAELSARLNRTGGTVVLDGLCSGVTGCAVTMRYDVIGSSSDKPLISGSSPMQLTRPDSERWAAEVAVPTVELDDGRYQVRATFSVDGGGTIADATTGFEHKAGLPRWFKSQAGISDEVPAPFTALQLDAADEKLAVRPWGRSYEFGVGPFLCQIKSNGKNLLARPMRLIAQIAGDRVPWPAARPKRLDASPARVVIAQESSAGEVKLTIRAQVEYDGFVRFDWRLRAERIVALQELALEIPLHSSRAKYLYTWRSVRSGALKKDYASEFKPIVWLGDEDRGLEWLCESDRNWRLSEPKKAVQVNARGGEVVLRLTLIDTPTEIGPDTGLDYTFALQATPLKPMRKSAWDYRIVRNPYYGYSLDMPKETINGKPALKHFADKGARAMLVLRWWDAFAYTSPLGHEEEFRALVQECHKYGIKVVPYVGGFVMSELAPESPAFRNEMAVKPFIPYPLNMPGLPGQMGFVACQRSCWQDWLVAGIARLMDEYDVDGVYLDSTTRPLPCTNTLHGCGYVRPDGTIRGTHPVFAVRRLLKRIYTVVKQRKPDGIVDLHVFDCMNAPALAFCTTYWNGEQLRRGPRFKPDALPLDRFRTEFMGHNWGVPADLLYYILGDNRQCWALAILHDVPVRAENLRDLDTEASLWTLREQFDVKNAEWLPYWRNGELVKIRPEGCYVSLYRHPANGVLAYVSNLGKETAQVEMILDAPALGLKPPLVARDALGGDVVECKGTTLSLSLPSQDWRVLRIGGRSAL